MERASRNRVNTYNLIQNQYHHQQPKDSHQTDQYSSHFGQSRTGQKFINTGCGTHGDVHIYDVACGNEVARLEYHIEAVRDCSWHPHLPMIVSSSWDGTIARWQFPGGEGRDKTPFPRPEQDTEEWSPY